MTSTYDPHEARYVDEADTRAEMTRVFDVCSQCRRCVDRCGSFPRLFDLVDRHPDREAGRLTPAQQDAVTDECFQCGRCLLDCPYRPEVDDASVDLPALLQRAVAMRRANQQLPMRRRLAVGVVGGTGVLGRVLAAAPPAANRVVAAPPGSLTRKVLGKVGLDTVAVLPPFVRERFTSWFAKRPKVRLTGRQASVAVVPTCLVDHHAPGIGRDLVRVYERNGIEVAVADVRCCGAPLLRSGDVAGFTKLARAGARKLAGLVGEGHDVVVAQPTCTLVVRDQWPAHAPGPDAATVAARTYDACEYLMHIDRGDDTRLDTEFSGTVPGNVTYHVACHVRGLHAGLPGRDVVRLTGSRVTLVERCGAANRALGPAPTASAAATRLGEDLVASTSRRDTEVVVSDCLVAGAAVHAEHPLQVLARAYGITDDV